MTVQALPEQILKQLDSLWFDLSKTHCGDTGLLRACAMTMIVVTEDGRDDPGGTVAALTQEHPSRAIILRLKGGDTERLQASVNPLCTVATGASERICCELIEISATAPSLSGVSPLLRSLIAPDLPVAIWFHQPCLLDHSELEPALGIADKIIIDSSQGGDIQSQLRLIQLAGRKGGIVADLAWTRLTPWREEIAHGVHEAQVENVSVSCVGSAPDISGYYMAAWATNCIGSGSAPQFEYNATENSIRIGSQGFPAVAPARADHELLSEELSIPGRDAVFEAALARVRTWL